MRLSSLLTVVFCLSTALLWSQTLDVAKKQVEARPLSPAGITIDGKLDELAWEQAKPATDFVALEPNPGEAAAQATAVRLLYDNTGLYIGAQLFDQEPTKVLKELVQRDNIGNADWFGVFIDAYRDGINGVGFIVSAAGVQFDAKYSVFGEDENWDAVWSSAVSRTDQGWVVEIKIPYAAIRFPEVPEQTWHVNFGRLIRRTQQKVFWNTVDPKVNGFLNQAGYLLGIKNIKSPLRLQATPFVAGYVQQYHDKNASPRNLNGSSFNAGMDVKYGLSDAYTLDMTLIPDFGEAQSDNQVLNLTPFEVQFTENRQFFTEGTELFNKGDLFYSRRAGGTPLHYGTVARQLQPGETVIENPQQAQLLNATKISGRSKNGLGLGLFNATSGRTWARVRNADGAERRIETDPLTNYNILVADQNLKNNSYATLINTLVWRNGADYDANVTAGVFELRDKKNRYSWQGSGKLSQLYFPDSTALGHNLTFSFGKNNGNWNWNVGYNEESDTYDPNDLGFLSNNNERTVEFSTNYNIFKPFGAFNRANFGAFVAYERLYQPNVYTSVGYNGWVYFETKKFWEINAWGYIQPGATFDYFEPRIPGRYYRFPAMNNVGFFIGSDARKQFRMTLNGNLRHFAEPGRWGFNLGLGPRYRFNDHLTLSGNVNYIRRNADVGFVSFLEQPSERQAVLGRRNVQIVENIGNASYTFNDKMALTLRARHYWSQVQYLDYHTLDAEGRLQPLDYNRSHNTQFNAFNIDLIYRWRFSPGSDVFLIWKNSILQQSTGIAEGYFQNLNTLFDNPQTNSLSLKVIYFLDYNALWQHHHKAG